MFPELLKCEPALRKRAKLKERLGPEDAQTAAPKKVNDAHGMVDETHRQIITA